MQWEITLHGECSVCVILLPAFTCKSLHINHSAIYSLVYNVLSVFLHCFVHSITRSCCLHAAKLASWKKTITHKELHSMLEREFYIVDCGHFSSECGRAVVGRTQLGLFRESFLQSLTCCRPPWSHLHWGQNHKANQPWCQCFKKQFPRPCIYLCIYFFKKSSLSNI